MDSTIRFRNLKFYSKDWKESIIIKKRMSRKIILKSENPIIHANFEYYYYYYERDIYMN